jgi:hypothetical protein
MAKEIIFTNKFGVELFPPKPASKEIPDWYKKQEEYMGNNNKKIPHPDPNQTSSSIKKCIPIFDCITAGYIIYSQVDVYIGQTDDGPMYQWAAQNAISFHSPEQAPTHPLSTGNAYPKWNNPYSIKTPKGYSTLFTQPFHRESVFTILPGIVDTDTYVANVNFPFVLNDSKFEGIIPAGTPIAQVIPFKRDSFKMKMGNKIDLENALKVENLIPLKFFNKYKTMFWSRKEYK